MGPFEEEEEETGIASDVVKVKGEDPATPGYYLRSVDTKNPRTVTIPQYWVNKTKQHTRAPLPHSQTTNKQKNKRGL